MNLMPVLGEMKSLTNSILEGASFLADTLASRLSGPRFLYKRLTDFLDESWLC